MFPVTGFFRRTLCPDGDACQRKTCLLSHDSNSAESPSTTLLESLLHETAVGSSHTESVVKSIELPCQVAEATAPFATKRTLLLDSERPTKIQRLERPHPPLSKRPATIPGTALIRTLPVRGEDMYFGLR